MDCKTCSIDGCEKKHYAHGWCNMHWSRWRRHGDPLKRLKRANGEGSTLPNGYQLVTVNGKQLLEHRRVMERKLGHSIPGGMEVHHKDQNPTNNEPENLELVTHAQHQRIHRNLRATCFRGHPWDEENTWWSKGGIRQCRACQRIRYQRRMASN